ncbi:MAG: aldo/keto reductase, partial [Stenotrophomonas maltophilia]
IDPSAAIASMLEHQRAGFTTWDLADHYGPAEDFMGQFRRQLSSTPGRESLSSIQAFTKWVPRPGPMTRQVVEQNVDLSLRRMDVPALDLLQFHWWDYGDARYLDALEHLSALREEGKIRHVALTNFDTEHLKLIVEQGIKIVSNQVQFSLIDRRPEIRMIQFCREHDIQLLAYGTVCGGLLTSKYLGQPEPSRRELTTASLGKYKQMVDAWGGWELFQELLNSLQDIAAAKQASIANVAVKYVLDSPAVAGAILGVRLGASDHMADNARTFDITLDSEDYDHLESVLRQAADLYQTIGDCGDEYRR